MGETVQKTRLDAIRGSFCLHGSHSREPDECLDFKDARYALLRRNGCTDFTKSNTNSLQKFPQGICEAPGDLPGII
jgi:hypothetical protein